MAGHGIEKGSSAQLEALAGGVAEGQGGGLLIVGADSGGG